jgi:hypothetical protein
MSTHSLGILSGMEKAASMTAVVDEAIRDLRARGADRAAKGLNILANPNSAFMERGHHAAKIVDAMREAHSKGIGLPTKMSEALADAVADNKDLDRNLRRIFKSQKAWLPAKPSVKPPVKPRCRGGKRASSAQGSRPPAPLASTALRDREAVR